MAQRSAGGGELEVETVGECPVCGACLVGLEGAVYEHVSMCLDSRGRQQRQQQQQQQQQRDDDGFSGWEVYGHERAVDMLEGGIRSLPNTVVSTDCPAGEDAGEDDVFVDVEGDGEGGFGGIQYTEEDLRRPRRDGQVAGMSPPCCLSPRVVCVLSWSCA